MEVPFTKGGKQKKESLFVFWGYVGLREDEDFVLDTQENMSNR